MNKQNNRRKCDLCSPRFDLKPLIHIVSAVMLMLLALPLMAQNDDAESTDEVLDLFDEDEERTKKGWIQFYASLGIMSLDADGRLSARPPNGNNTTIIDFDRAGLKETDNSYWLSLNWRSANSHWGAWFGSWEYDVGVTNQWGLRDTEE